MTDENIQADNSQVDNDQVDEQIDDDVTKQSDGEFMEDTVKQIKETQKAVLGDDNDVDNDNTENETQDNDDIIPDLAGKDIPDVFTKAAEASGMSSTDIIALANKHTDEQLMEMIPSLEAALKEPEEKDDNKDDVKQDDKETKDDNKQADADLEAKIADRIAKQLEEKFGASLEEIEKFKADQKEQSDKQTVETASKLFDEASKEFPVFGKTDELPRFPSGRLKGQLITTSPEMKARLEVLRYAGTFISQGSDRDTALTNGLATYKGLHLAKELERKQVRDLKQHETRLSGARVGRETKKKYADTRDEIIDDIKRLKSAAGAD